MVRNQLTQINTLTQQLQQIQAYVKAFDDPEQLLNIVGADELMNSLNASGVGQTISELQQSVSGVEALRYSANGPYTSLGSTFTTPGGMQVPRTEQLYRKCPQRCRAVRLALLKRSLSYSPRVSTERRSPLHG